MNLNIADKKVIKVYGEPTSRGSGDNIKLSSKYLGNVTVKGAK